MFDFLKRKKPAKNNPKIFISHRHKDNPIADLFVKLIKCAFIIENHDIRCTSLPPHALSVGSNIFETLKEEVKNAEIVLGLISKRVDESEYVLFELGASWGNSIPTFPLLITGAIPNDIPGPLKQKKSVSLSQSEDCFQLIADMKKIISAEYRVDNAIEISKAINNLITHQNEHSEVSNLNELVQKKAKVYLKKREIRDYMYSWISESGRTLIFTRDLSWVDDEEMTLMLKNKATKGDLIICLPKLIDKVLHFQNSGAIIIEYSNFDYTPVSRFTITNFGREDAKIAVGKSLENNIHMIEEYKNGEHPFFHVASDLVNLLRKNNQTK